jgi:hypothetical protein
MLVCLWPKNKTKKVPKRDFFNNSPFGCAQGDKYRAPRQSERTGPPGG